MEEEIVQLKAELEKQRTRCARLEDELDDLAVDNDRLRNLLASSGGNPSGSLFTSKNVTSHSQNTGGGLAGNFSSTGQTSDESDWNDLLLDGDDSCLALAHTTLPNACGGMNALCVAFCPHPGSPSLECNAIACGGVDKTLRVYGTTDGFKADPTALLSVKLSAPILAIDCHGPYVACSMMDGSHAVIDVSAPSNPPDNEDKISNVTIFSDHTKYVVTIKWSPDGLYLATVSHDKTVNLYRKTVSSDGQTNLIKIHTARFMVTPEYAVFARNSTSVQDFEMKKSDGGKNENAEENEGNEGDKEEGEVGTEGTDVDNNCEWELIIALRDTSYLVYLHCGTYKQRHITLNENLYDTHCSFTPLHLSISPNKKYLLIATDKNFHFIVKIGSYRRLRFLAGGHSSGDYGKPRVAWDLSGRYVYSNNEEGTSISVYSVSAEKCVRSIGVHTGSVRDVICHPSKAVIATASYDKSVVIFTAP